jgi:hypothetical protein
MQFVRQHLWSIVLTVVATIPLVGLMVYAELAKTRSAADLAVADRCMDWSRKSAGAQLADGRELAARCNQYFRVRSESEADEDVERWQARTARR